jgi:hypothetical protein
MRTLIILGLAGVLVFEAASHASAQGAYGRPYAFKDEPVMSINNSYLGYGNFVYPGPGLPAHANPPGWYSAPRTWTPAPAQAHARVYVRRPAPAPAPAPARRTIRWNGWQWVYAN